MSKQVKAHQLVGLENGELVNLGIFSKKPTWLLNNVFPKLFDFKIESMSTTVDEEKVIDIDTVDVRDEVFIVTLEMDKKLLLLNDLESTFTLPNMSVEKVYEGQLILEEMYEKRNVLNETDIVDNGTTLSRKLVVTELTEVDLERELENFSKDINKEKVEKAITLPLYNFKTRAKVSPVQDTTVASGEEPELELDTTNVDTKKEEELTMPEVNEDTDEKEKAEKERLAKEKAEKERLAKEKAEQEKAEKKRLAKEKAEKEKAEKEEKERLAKEQAEKEEQERLAKEKAEKEEKERLAKEKAEKEEKERLAKEKAEKEEQERLAKEKAEKEERLAKEQAQQEDEEEVVILEDYDASHIGVKGDLSTMTDEDIQKAMELVAEQSKTLVKVTREQTNVEKYQYVLNTDDSELNDVELYVKSVLDQSSPREVADGRLITDSFSHEEYNEIFGGKDLAKMPQLEVVPNLDENGKRIPMVNPPLRAYRFANQPYSLEEELFIEKYMNKRKANFKHDSEIELRKFYNGEYDDVDEDGNEVESITIKDDFEPSLDGLEELVKKQNEKLQSEEVTEEVVEDNVDHLAEELELEEEVTEEVTEELTEDEEIDKYLEDLKTDELALGFEDLLIEDGESPQSLEESTEEEVAEEDDDGDLNVDWMELIDDLGDLDF